MDALYRSLRCELDVLSTESRSYQAVRKLVESDEASKRNIQIKNVFKLHRPVEEHAFRQLKLANHRQLFHASKVSLTSLMPCHSSARLITTGLP